MKNKIISFENIQHSTGIRWAVLFDKEIPGSDVKGFSVFREFKEDPEWFVGDVHVMGLTEEGELNNSWSFEISQTRDQEALQICRLIANGKICLSAICKKGHVDSDLANLVVLRV